MLEIRRCETVELAKARTGARACWRADHRFRRLRAPQRARHHRPSRGAPQLSRWTSPPSPRPVFAAALGDRARQRVLGAVPFAPLPGAHPRAGTGRRERALAGGVHAGRARRSSFYAGAHENTLRMLIGGGVLLVIVLSSPELASAWRKASSRTSTLPRCWPGADAREALLLAGVMTGALGRRGCLGVKVSPSPAAESSRPMRSRPRIAIPPTSPRDLAISLVLVPRGVGVLRAAGWDIFFEHALSRSSSGPRPSSIVVHYDAGARAVPARARLRRRRHALDGRPPGIVPERSARRPRRGLVAAYAYRPSAVLAMLALEALLLAQRAALCDCGKLHDTRVCGPPRVSERLLSPYLSMRQQRIEKEIVRHGFITP